MPMPKLQIGTAGISNRNDLKFAERQLSVPLTSETWLVHAKVCEPHLNPPVCMNFPGFSF